MYLLYIYMYTYMYVLLPIMHVLYTTRDSKHNTAQYNTKPEAVLFSLTHLTYYYASPPVHAALCQSGQLM